MQKVKKMGVWELTLLVLVNMMGSGIILLPTKLLLVRFQFSAGLLPVVQ